MKYRTQPLAAEWLKIKHSRIVWATFLAFALAPIMGGVFMIILGNPELAEKSSALNSKAEVMSIVANWDSFLGVLSQAMGVGGIMVFGFVISWVFGREYSDGTAKDLLALPVSRARILHAKFWLYIGWCLALALSNLAIGLLIGAALQLPGFEMALFLAHLKTYAITTGLTILIGTPIALFALWGKGYLAPLAFVALTLVFAQIMAALGMGSYFPWAVPGIYSGTGGADTIPLDVWSYVILFVVSALGYFATILYWRLADQD